MELIPGSSVPATPVQPGGQTLRKLEAVDRGARPCSGRGDWTGLGLRRQLRQRRGGKEGGTLNGTYASFPDYLDPALSYTAEGWTAMYDTYIPLLTYAHADGAGGQQGRSPAWPRACRRSPTAARPTR